MMTATKFNPFYDMKTRKKNLFECFFLFQSVQHDGSYVIKTRLHLLPPSQKWSKEKKNYFFLKGYFLNINPIQNDGMIPYG